MTGDSLTPERPSRKGPGGPESGQDPQLGTGRRGGGQIGPQNGTQSLDPNEQAFLDLHAPAEPRHVDCPGYHSGLGANGLPWPATRQPAYRQWPDQITDLNLPEDPRDHRT